MTIQTDYTARYEAVLKPLASALQDLIYDYLEGEVRIDRVSARAKSIDRFVKKAAKVRDDGSPKYAEPLSQIQDQIGARVIVFYKSDVARISDLLKKYFRTTESQEIVPDSQWEFGYFGRHFICLFPHEILDGAWPKEHVPRFFELQIKTLFQHAWAEAEHDLGYKPESGDLSDDQIRMLAFTSAQAWGADRGFEELFTQLSAKSQCGKSL